LSLELTTLRLLRTREKYEKLARAVPLKALDAHTQTLIKDFGAYYREFKDAQSIEVGPFMHWFKAYRHPNLKDEAEAVYSAVIQKIKEPVNEAVEEGLMGRLVAADVAHDIVKTLEDYNNGGEVDLYLALRSHMERFEQQLNRKVKNPQVLTPIEDLLAQQENDVGLHWRLPSLNRSMRPVRAGDFIVLAARPDKGKTSFMASELTYMASQVDTLYPGENRSILWFNNEGPGDRIVTRCFQAALQCTMEDLVKYSKEPASSEEAVKKYRSALREKYAHALGGRGGTLRIFDIHDFWNHEVEDLMTLHKPAAVLFDMVDNIKFGGEANNNGQRTDQLLEAMYQWARLMGVKHDCGVFATSQISADGDGLQYPTLPMLKDSKTGKQGAADAIITMGAVNDPMLENSRYFGTTKNKLVRTGQAKSPQVEAIFNGDRCKFTEAGHG
jgi:replicative DNA helicase